MNFSVRQYREFRFEDSLMIRRTRRQPRSIAILSSAFNKKARAHGINRSRRFSTNNRVTPVPRPVCGAMGYFCAMFNYLLPPLVPSRRIVNEVYAYIASINTADHGPGISPSTLSECRTLRSRRRRTIDVVRGHYLRRQYYSYWYFREEQPESFRACLTRRIPDGYHQQWSSLWWLISPKL